MINKLIGKASERDGNNQVFLWIDVSQNWHDNGAVEPNAFKYEFSGSIFMYNEALMSELSSLLVQTRKELNMSQFLPFTERYVNSDICAISARICEYQALFYIMRAKNR